MSAEAPATVELSDAAMSRIKQMLDGSIATVIAAFETKFNSMQQRIDVLEGEVMDRDVEIRSLHEQLVRQGKALEEQQERTEGIDLNRRLSTLILTCDDFISKTTDEDVEQKISQVLNQRFPWLNMTPKDIQSAHRLQANNKVIVRFVKRRMRDAVYEGRFELVNRTARDARRLSPLYITESLTPKNREVYSYLLEARKPVNGSKVASVFSRRGLVFCRVERGGPNISVPDLQRAQRIPERSLDLQREPWWELTSDSIHCSGAEERCDLEALDAPRCRCRPGFVELQGRCHAFSRLGEPCHHRFQCQTLDVLSTCSEAGRCVCRGLARPLGGHCSLSGSGGGDGAPGPGPDVRSPLRYPLWMVAIMMLPGLLFVCLAAMLKRSCLRASGRGSAHRRRTMSVWSLSGAPRVAPTGSTSAAHGDGGALPPLRTGPTRGESARLRELLPPPYTPPPSYEETVRTKPPPVQ
ncbi:hypothetical protein FJT64_019506 [Amphibalanus amphitrite]|uniref:EB domain-containing protein n=1 Tax=Amphibalanus amphitrite TaxID=1232801 RepID=A0A6A4X356_AMPAM|nr:hypothetical protein FJT64_019506 [Amphibalanus amphitrite]